MSYDKYRWIIASNVMPYLPANTRWPDLIAAGAADTIIKGLEEFGFYIVPKEAVTGGTPCHSVEHAMPETTTKGEQR